MDFGALLEALSILKVAALCLLVFAGVLPPLGVQERVTEEGVVAALSAVHPAVTKGEEYWGAEVAKTSSPYLQASF